MALSQEFTRMVVQSRSERFSVPEVKLKGCFCGSCGVRSEKLPGGSLELTSYFERKRASGIGHRPEKKERREDI
jgi:hypothetical protein